MLINYICVEMAMLLVKIHPSGVTISLFGRKMIDNVSSCLLSDVLRAADGYRL